MSSRASGAIATKSYPIKTPERCPHCNSKRLIKKKGVRKKKLENVPLFQCRSCGRTFAPGPRAIRNKTYPLPEILEALPLYDRGNTLEATAENISSRYGHRVIENYQLFKKVVGRQEISRIGVRYVNRIDVPLTRIEGHDLYEFVKVGVSLPVGLAESVGAYYVNSIFVDKETGMNVRIQGGTIVPVILEHASRLLDIDVYIDKDLPTREDAFWVRVDEIRVTKNRVLELCITDEARSLFR